MNVRDIFEQRIPGRINAEPGKAKAINTIYQFDVTGDQAGKWYVDLTCDPPAVAEGEHAEPVCTVTVGDTDLIDIVEGKLNPQMAFMGGKLKIAGDMSAAIKLSQVI